MRFWVRPARISPWTGPDANVARSGAGAGGLRRLEELDRVDREQGLGAMPLGTPDDTCPAGPATAAPGVPPGPSSPAC